MYMLNVYKFTYTHIYFSNLTRKESFMALCSSQCSDHLKGFVDEFLNTFPLRTNNIIITIIMVVIVIKTTTITC